MMNGLLAVPISQIIVNIPDCATGSHDDHDVITINTENCPAPLPELPPLIPGWAFFLAAILILAFIIATAFVRWRRHERLETEFAAEQETERVKANRKTTSCPTCGTVYVPEGKRT